MLDLHRRRDARATIVLTPVENPSAYGLVETSEAGDVRRFLEKPGANEVTCDTINAGIYILETETFDRIPAGTNWSIERKYFPSLVERGDTFVAYVDRGYWIDIGTPEKYIQAHRDIMTGACHAYPFAGDTTGQPRVALDAVVDPEARLEGPCYLAPHARVDAGARIAPHSVIGTSASVGPGAVIDGAVLWPGSTVGPEATIRHAILGRDVTVEEYAVVGPGAVVGDKSVITRYTQVG